MAAATSVSGPRQGSPAYGVRAAVKVPGAGTATDAVPTVQASTDLLTAVPKRLLRGPAAPQRPPRRDAAAQDARAAGLLQRPAVVRGVRHRGDPARAQPRRAGATVPDAVGRRCASSLLLVVVVASYRQACSRLPQRRRLLRGQPRATSGATAGLVRGERAAGRLRADRRGVGRRRRGQHHLRGPGLAPHAVR